MKRWLKGGLWIVFATGVLFGILETVDAGFWIHKWTIKLPQTRDLRLVGQWTGTWTLSDDPTPRLRITTFRANGTGEWTDPSRGFHLPFEWGTEKGVLYTRRLATDWWTGEQRGYSITPGRSEIKYTYARTFDPVCTSMKRSTTRSVGVSK